MSDEDGRTGLEGEMGEKKTESEQKKKNSICLRNGEPEERGVLRDVNKGSERLKRSTGDCTCV